MGSSPPEVSASNVVPKYEVKLLMDPKTVLDANNNLQPAVVGMFGLATTVKKMSVQFLDTNDRDMYENGWSPRIRRAQGEPDFELTYKRRYTVTDGNIEVALTIANKDGFDSTTNYKAQIDWGFQNQTLSINRDKSYSALGYNDLELPDEVHSRTMLIDKAPDKFVHFGSDNWGTNALSESRICGPVHVERYTGIWSKEELDIEVWPIKDARGTGTEYIVEVSFKVKEHAIALGKHDDLIKVLDKNGWFVARESLKTKLIMERY